MKVTDRTTAGSKLPRKWSEQQIDDNIERRENQHHQVSNFIMSKA